jgi:putative nucleotidyltransferase with HDIG domain
MSRPNLLQAMAALQQLPNLPGTTRQVLEYLNDEDTDLSRIVQAIECDPGLVIRTLRTANSPFFGLTHRVQTIQEAVVVLGMSNLRMIVMTAMLTAQKFPNLAQSTRASALLRHSLAVGICASIIGRDNKLDRNLLFLAGILHDIGTLALMSTYPDLYAEVEKVCDAQDLLSFEAELQVFGFDHATIGAALCRHWTLPEAIAQAIDGHHFLAAPAVLSAGVPRQDVLAGVVHLADAIVHGLDLEHDPHATVPPVSDAMWQRLIGTQDQLVDNLSEVTLLYQELVMLVDS